MFNEQIEPCESPTDYNWRQDLADAAEAIGAAGDARQHGDHARTDDRTDYAETMLAHAAKWSSRS